MNTALPDTPSNSVTRSLAVNLLLSLAALAACQSPPSAVVAPVSEFSAPGSSMPAPQEPFDTTPITPVESAGAAAA